LDLTEFNAATQRLAEYSKRTVPEMAKINAQILMRAVAKETPKRTGNLRAGWLPAWRSVGLPGNAYAGRARYGQQPPRQLSRLGKDGKRKKSRERMVAEGKVISDLKATSPTFTAVNSSHAIRRGGKKVRYGYVYNAWDHFLERAVAKATDKVKQITEKQMDKLIKKAGF
jgi:hypothetical protein